MERIYQGLPLRELGGDAGFRRPTQPSSERVTLESPALAVMTDFTRATPATIRPQAPLAGANQFMITRGVRLLLVVDEHEIVLGVLTANDLLGERPMLAATGRGVRRDELTAADVMTPAERVEVIELAEVEHARAGRQHALVVERAMVRGIFSMSQIARQLGVSVPAGGEVALTFSEIEAALVK